MISLITVTLGAGCLFLAMTIVGRFFLKLSGFHNLYLAPIVGFCLLVLASYIQVRFFWRNLWLYSVIFAILIFAVILKTKLRVFTGFMETIKLAAISLLILATIYFPYALRINAPALTTITSGNNDLGSYILQSQGIKLNGLESGLFISGIEIHNWTIYDHPGIMTLLAHLSTITGLETWRFGLILVFLGFMTVTSSLAALMKAKTETEAPLSFKELATIFITVTFPYILYITHNGFIAHLFSIGIITGFMATIINFKQSLRNRAALNILFLSSSIYVSTEYFFLVPCFVIVYYLISFSLIKLKFDKHKVNSGESTVLEIKTGIWLTCFSFFLTLALNLPSRNILWHALTATSKSGVAGWNLEIFNPLTWISLNQIGQSNFVSKSSPIIIAILLTAIAILSTRRTLKSHEKALIVTCLFLMMVSIIIWGASGYQAWKLITTFAVFVIPTLVMHLNSKSLARPVLLLLSVTNLAIYSAGTNFLNLDFQKRDISGRYVSQDLVNAANYINDSSSKHIVIATSSLFQNMTLTSMFSKKTIYMEGPSYFGTSASIPPTQKCAIYDFFSTNSDNLNESIVFGDFLVTAGCHN